MSRSEDAGTDRSSSRGANAQLLGARFTRHTASSAASLRARGRSVVRVAPAFVNVSALVTRKLDDLRSQEAAVAHGATEDSSSRGVRGRGLLARSQHVEYDVHDASLLSASELVASTSGDAATAPQGDDCGEGTHALAAASPEGLSPRTQSSAVSSASGRPRHGLLL
jgi:hypothetical protein